MGWTGGTTGRATAACRRAAEFNRRTTAARITYRATEFARGGPLTWTEAAALASAGEKGPPRSWWHFAVRDTAHALAFAWLRIDPDGWFRPTYAAQLAGEVAAGRLPARGAWRRWTNNPGQDRHTRRRMDTLRRIRRMDPTERKVAQLYGWWSRYPNRPGRVHGPVLARRAGTAAAAGPHVAPRWPVRRLRIAWWLARAVAAHHIRAASVPDAWAVATSASDRVNASTPYARTGHTCTGGVSAADADRR
jgi:hypothetical protein